MIHARGQENVWNLACFTRGAGGYGSFVFLLEVVFVFRITYHLGSFGIQS